MSENRCYKPVHVQSKMSRENNLKGRRPLINIGYPRGSQRDAQGRHGARRVISWRPGRVPGIFQSKVFINQPAER